MEHPGRRAPSCTILESGCVGRRRGRPGLSEEREMPRGDTPARDASGANVLLPTHATRIVSLVPSVTETLVAVGLEDALVGRTDFCVHPVSLAGRVPPVGGTKNPRLEDILDLAPDLVLANREENREIDVRRLRERGLRVWVDHPVTLDDTLEQVRRLAALGAPAEPATALLDRLAAAIARAAAKHPARARSCFLACWKDPWMTIGRETYAHHVLAASGLANIFADAPGHYPRTDLDEVARRAPEIVLLPDEPYFFTAVDVDELAQGPLGDSPAVRTGRVHVIDGTLPFWHGPRLAEALEVLRRLANNESAPASA